MASGKGLADPLRGGGAFDDQDMEDLTAHLAALPGAGGRRPSNDDGLDLGDNGELLQGNMDRFRALAGDDPGDDLFTSFGGLGRGGPLGGPMGHHQPHGHDDHAADPAGAASIIYTTNYPTYGDLSAKPPSYEDSVMYEQAPPSMHATHAEHGGGVGGGVGAAAAGQAFADPLGPLGEFGAAPAAPAAAGPPPPSLAGSAAAAERGPLSGRSPLDGGEPSHEGGGHLPAAAGAAPTAGGGGHWLSPGSAGAGGGGGGAGGRGGSEGTPPATAGAAHRLPGR
ncbi:hypothetical protein GPECTOR_77g44 [Gonium pectorale]|uniref:Uncharacterized protein n=1 Tax=Gonium pectorale TaxID=33097 RepID=A0A150G281_GONPE|nr:hypothetical protein GPECTOR_77g44 [Gonium pectorale]|eukprot:KXZ43948.1 hypothetical protein GPECTOR_77g44 [Gonium pectorale]